jgi:hypothetical protein
MAQHRALLPPVVSLAQMLQRAGLRCIKAGMDFPIRHAFTTFWLTAEYICTADGIAVPEATVTEATHHEALFPVTDSVFPSTGATYHARPTPSRLEAPLPRDSSSGHESGATDAAGSPRPSLGEDKASDSAGVNEPGRPRKRIQAPVQPPVGV